MRRIPRWQFFLLTLLLCACTALPVEAAKKSVAVMPLENVSGYSAGKVAEVLTEQIIAAINRSGVFIVAERTQLGKAMRELGFQSTGAVAPNQAIQLGQMIGAQYTLVGKVTMAETVINQTGSLIDKILLGASSLAGRYRGKVAMNIRFVDNKTGENILTIQAEGAKVDNNQSIALHKACQEAAEKAMESMLQEFPLVASIRDVDGDIIYIDRGADAGLKPGDELELVREGKAITDREGNILTVKYISLGRARIEDVEEKFAICRVTDKTGPIMVGDLAKRGGK